MPAKAPSDPKASKRDAIVEVLMQLAAVRPWDEIELTDIAQAANVTLAEFRDFFPSKGAVLGAFSRMIDRQVLEGTTEDLANEPARERIFDIFMRRFDALAPYKAALRRIMPAFQFDPLALMALNRAALNSQRFMLAAARIPTEGHLGHLKLQGAVMVFANTMKTWLDDDDPALARTMARLDRELKRGERFLERADDLRRLAAPFRAILREAAGSRRDRRATRRGPATDGETSDPAAAI